MFIGVLEAFCCGNFVAVEKSYLEFEKIIL
jgi:hypothetical protein